MELGPDDIGNEVQCTGVRVQNGRGMMCIMHSMGARCEGQQFVVQELGTESTELEINEILTV